MHRKHVRLCHTYYQCGQREFTVKSPTFKSNHMQKKHGHYSEATFDDSLLVYVILQECGSRDAVKLKTILADQESPHVFSTKNGYLCLLTFSLHVPGVSLPVPGLRGSPPPWQCLRLLWDPGGNILPWESRAKTRKISGHNKLRFSDLYCDKHLLISRRFISDLFIMSQNHSSPQQQSRYALHNHIVIMYIK